MTVKDFNENFWDQLMEKLPDKKHNFLLGDFNVDLMKTDSDEDSMTYLDTLTSNLFVPHIIYPTRITPHTKKICLTSLKENQEISQLLYLTI